MAAQVKKVEVGAALVGVNAPDTEDQINCYRTSDLDRSPCGHEVSRGN